jgi:hypothetical protein
VLTYQNGVDDLIALADCVFCVSCYVDCDGASSDCI